MPISKVKGWLVLQTVEMASLLAVWIIEGLFKVEYCAAESWCRPWLRYAQRFIRNTILSKWSCQSWLTGAQL